MLTVLGNGEAASALVKGVLLLTVIVAAILFIWRAIQGPHAAVWGRLAGAMVAFALAEAYWFAAEVFMGRSVLGPSPADAFRAVGYGLLLAALVGSIPGRRSSRLQARFALDAVVVFTSLFAIAWIVFGRSMVSGEPGLSMLAPSASASMDLVLLAFLVFVLRVVRGVHRSQVLLFGLGLLLWTVVDVAYAAQVADGGSKSGRPIDALWAGGYIAFALAAVVRSGADSASRRAVPEKAWANAIYVPIVVLVPVAVVDYWAVRSMDPVLFGTGVLFVGALAGRQVLYARELRESHQHAERQADALEAAQALAHIGSWEYDLASGHLEVSRETARIFGLDRFDASFEAIMARVHADDVALVETTFFDAVEERRPFSQKHRIVVDGQIRHVEHFGATEGDGYARVRAVGTVQDVTERTRAEEELRFQARLLDSVDQTVVATDLEGRITYWNAAAEKMYGWSRQDVMGKEYADMMPVPESRDEARAARAVLQDGGSWSGEMTVRDKAGRDFLVESRATLLLDGEGRPAGTIGVAQDITERKQMEVDLQERQAALEEAQRIACLGSWTWDPATDATTWSDMMYTIFERDRASGPTGIEESLAMFAPESRERLQATLEKVIEDGTSYGLDLEVNLPSGTKHVASRGEAVRDGDKLVMLRGTVQDISHRKETEQAMRFQARLLEEVGQAVFATDLEGKITFWNPAAQVLFGWARDEVLDRSISDVLGQEQASESSGPDEAAVDQWLRRKDGTNVLISLARSAMVDADGHLVGFIGIAQDVTAQRVTQQRYQEMIEFSPDGMFRTTPTGVLQYANPASAAMLGYASADQLLEEVDRVTDVYVDPADRQRLLAELEKERPEPVEAPFRRRDGSAIWVEIRARRHRDPDGSWIIEGSFHDLSARRDREALAQRLATIIESSEEAIYSKDLDGVVTTWNPGAQRLYGYTADEAVGQTVEGLIVPEAQAAEYARFMERVWAGRVVGRVETVRRRKDGALVDVSVTFTPLRDASGAVVGVSVSGHDIGDRKRAEEAEKTRMENEHLKELDQTLRDFINAAAHDLNQPLTPMRFALGTLAPDLEHMPARARSTVNMIERSVDRMALLVQDLLDVARLESGTLKFSMAALDLCELLTETDEFFGEQTQEAGVTLQVLASEPLPVMADDRRIIQVLFNFVSNAIKFTPEGGEITIRGRTLEGFARVEVQDTGPGLTEDQIAKLFQAFSQVHKVTRQAPKGTGLGLYISKGIIEKHGGQVGVKSEGPGHGSTFWFTLPFAPEGKTRKD